MVLECVSGELINEMKDKFDMFYCHFKTEVKSAPLYLLLLAVLCDQLKWVDFTQYNTGEF